MATTNIKVCDGKTLLQQVEKAGKPKSFTIPRELTFECSIVVDKELADKIDMDAVLAEKIFLKTSAAYKKLGTDLGKIAKKIDLVPENDHEQIVMSSRQRRLMQRMIDGSEDLTEDSF